MLINTGKLIALAALIALASCARDEAPACNTEAPGFLISNVLILDGSGTPAVAGAVRVRDGKIAALGDLAACTGETQVDGGGQVLAPGFIDTHSHADSNIFGQPDALPVISQGITTVVVGQDGGSPYPLAGFFRQLEAAPATVNVASYVGHNTLRDEVMGDDFRRTATAVETERMKALLAKELESGALGLATGLEYEPGIHSDTDEIVALAEVAADVGGRYISHLRSEDRWFEAAIDEIILIGRETGMPVQASHIKLAMKRLWGSAPELLAKLNAARAEGVNITADIYPYEYWQSSIMVLLPERDPGDREAIAEVLDQIAPPDGLWMTQFEPNPEYVGKTLTEIAALREVDVITAFTQIAEEALDWEAEHGESAEAIIGTSMVESDIDELMSWPYTNICTDGGIVDLHPRSRGTFPRVLGRYVREKKLLTLEEAVRKMTSLSAHNMGFTDRGLIREGMVADLVLFDPKTVIDRATPTEPNLLSTGITTVWVGGEIVYTDGAATDARPGKVIRRDTPATREKPEH
ncbi:MAG TPA: D-aminoacylase [Woeseiaceae bacterium]|nr:D-aminoacylase [Woeseiaceae bacterium]